MCFRRCVSRFVFQPITTFSCLLSSPAEIYTSSSSVKIQDDGDLQLDELEDIWNAAPKFPEVGPNENSRIDVDGFVQIYRDVDDLFEDDENSDDDNNDASGGGEASTLKLKNAEAENGDAEEDDDDDQDETFEAELERVFKSSLCDNDGLLSKESLMSWEEIEKLMEEGLVGEDEIDELWEKTPKSPGTNNQLDVDGFLSFNVALDGLFEFDDEDSEGADVPEVGDNIVAAVEETKKEDVPKPVVEDEDLPPGVLFSLIADEDYQVGMEELKRWGELQDMIEEGDLLPSELQTIYDGIESAESGKLDETGFTKLFEAIDALFEDDGEEEEKGEAAESADSRVKDDLLGFIDLFLEDEDLLPCGLEASEKDQKQVSNIVSALEGQPTNIIRQKNGGIDLKDLVGTWELIYSSSSAMKFNQGLSGVGGSFPNGKFAGVKQTLETTKFVNDMEYIERVEVNPSSASFDVKVNGSWDLRTSVSLFTGLPTIVVAVEPDRVTYGPTSTRADHWKSLGPMNLLDLTYLDDDLRVMRGCTSADTIIIFKKVP